MGVITRRGLYKPAITEPNYREAVDPNWDLIDTLVSSGQDGAIATGFHVPGGGYPLATSTQAVIANRAYALRFVAARNITISKIAFGLTTAAGSNDNCDAGIFSADGTVMLSSAGSTAGKLNAIAGSVQTLNLQAAVPLVAGTVYYAAFAAGPVGTTAAILGATSLVNPMSFLLGNAPPNLIQGFANGFFPLSAPFVIASNITACPGLALLI